MGVRALVSCALRVCVCTCVGRWVGCTHSLPLIETRVLPRAGSACSDTSTMSGSSQASCPVGVSWFLVAGGVLGVLVGWFVVLGGV